MAKIIPMTIRTEVVERTLAAKQQANTQALIAKVRANASATGWQKLRQYLNEEVF
jgi:flagellar basal body rod protein FlgF